MKQKKAHASHPVGNRTVIGIICIVVALAICFGIAPLVNRLSDGKTKIVRLIRDISAGATITEADIERYRTKGGNSTLQFRIKSYPINTKG